MPEEFLKMTTDSLKASLQCAIDRAIEAQEEFAEFKIIQSLWNIPQVQKNILGYISDNEYASVNIEKIKDAYRLTIKLNG